MPRNGLGNFLANAIPAVVDLLPFPGAGIVGDIVGGLLGGNNPQPSVVVPPAIVPPVAQPAPQLPALPPRSFTAGNMNNRNADSASEKIDVMALLKQYWFIPVGLLAVWFVGKKKSAY
jgi:hypothetical protein